jgi:hypothetical protein
LASRFPVFRAAFAFARWRALALVMSSSPFKVAFRAFIASAPIVSIIRRPRQPWLREIFESAMRPTSAFAVHPQRSQLIWDLAAQSITVGART